MDPRQVPVEIYKFFTRENFSDDREVVSYQKESLVEEKVITGGNIVRIEIYDNTLTKEGGRLFSLYAGPHPIGIDSEETVSVFCYWSENNRTFKIQTRADLYSDFSLITLFNSRQALNRALDLIKECNS